MKIYQLVEYVPYEGEDVYATFIGMPSKTQIKDAIKENCVFTAERLEEASDKLLKGCTVAYHTGYIELEELNYYVGEGSDP